jgi:hypothetical protein
MKRLIVLAASAALLAGVSVSSFASTKSVESRCKAQAEKHKISEDKLDAYVKTCVDKHMKHMKRVKHVKHEQKAAPEAATPAAPAPAPAAPTQPGQ